MKILTMTVSRRRFVVLSAATGLTSRACADIHKDAKNDFADTGSGLVDDLVNWDLFLARHDLLWDTVPTMWGESPFLGNGRLALSVRGSLATRRLYGFRSTT